jgi:hypothetical protein
MRNTWLAVGLCVLVGCPGKAPPDQNNPDAAGDDADGSVTPTSLTLSGKVVSYFTGEALDTTAITSDGLVPAVATTSAADGAYMIDVAVGSKLFAITSRTGARTSRSAVITVADMPLTQDLYVLPDGDVGRQFSSVGVAQTTGTLLAAELQKNNGTPFEGLAVGAITLVDNANAPVPGISGPYFFGTLGDIELNATLAVSTAYGTPPRARVAFLNVPPGNYKLLVAYTNGMGQPATNTTPVAISAGGATLALSGGMMAQMAPPPPTDPTFAIDIYPRLQKASAGGLGCANCHTATGPTGANALPYDGPAQTTLDLMKATAGVIATATPATSLFLTMPLYEVAPPQNHPNATFLDVNDTDYKLFLLWITNGAKP